MARMISKIYQKSLFLSLQMLVNILQLCLHTFNHHHNNSRPDILNRETFSTSIVAYRCIYSIRRICTAFFIHNIKREEAEKKTEERKKKEKKIFGTICLHFTSLRDYCVLGLSLCVIILYRRYIYIYIYTCICEYVYGGLSWYGKSVLLSRHVIH